MKSSPSLSLACLRDHSRINNEIFLFLCSHQRVLRGVLSKLEGSRLSLRQDQPIIVLFLYALNYGNFYLYLVQLILPSVVAYLKARKY